MNRLAAVPAIAADAPAAAAKPAFVVWTVATPTSVFSLTIVPPAAVMAARAAASDAPSAYRTTNSCPWSACGPWAPAPVDVTTTGNAMQVTVATAGTSLFIRTSQTMNCRGARGSIAPLAGQSIGGRQRSKLTAS